MTRKSIPVLTCLLLFTAAVFCQSTQNPIPDKMMQDVYNKIKTPYKYGLVMLPPDNAKKLDCPGIFRRGNLWFMVYSVADEKGSETWLAQSNNLLNWTTKGRILSASDAAVTWDARKKAGYPALQELDWEGGYQWLKYNNRYWMSYTGSSNQGYNTGPLSIGMSYSYQDPSRVYEWQRYDKPALSPQDADTRWSENISISNSFVLRDNQQFTGHPFVMFYNANGDSLARTAGTGRINMAVSDDMIRWKRYGRGSVINHNAGISGNPVIQKIDNLYVMFYYGLAWKDRKDTGAFTRFACSYDLINWTDWLGQDLIKPSEPYDEAHAYKSSVIKYRGVVYHFYCAVDKKNQSGIAVATSMDMGKSSLAFSK